MGLIVRNVNFGGRLRGTFPQVPPPPPAPSDQYAQYTVLDLPGTGTNNSNNNVFVDSSSNAFSITRVGNTTQGSFSPYSTAPGYWSNYFDGSGDKLTIPPGAAFAYGTGAFTIEVWVNPQAFTSPYTTGVVFGQNRSGTNYLIAGLDSSYRPYFTWGTGGGGTSLTSSTAISLNTWSHIAWVREGTGTNQFKMYVNGVLAGTGTVAQDFNDTSAYQPCVGGYAHSAELDYKGYISNLRVVKGTAVYTNTFTPSTTPLSAVSGTSLLTCQSNRFIDNSANNFTITRNGDTSVSAFGPFAPASSYNAATMGGSMYFDGSGDYLSISRNNAFLPIANEDFTIEAWVYLTGTPSAQGAGIVGLGEYGLDSDWNINIKSNFEVVFWIQTTSTEYKNTITPVTLNSWNHIAVSRFGTGSNNLKVFVNGVGQSFTTNSTTVGIGNRNLTIGADQNGDEFNLTGYISNLRIVKGTAVYTSNFTPPTAPVAAITGTSLLLNGTNAAIYDASTKNNLETVGNAAVSTTVSANGSMYFNGSGNSLSIPSNSNLSFGTGDFTIEGWINTSNAAGTQVIYDLRTPNVENGGFDIFIQQSVLKASTINNVFIFGSIAISSNTWTHFAITRSGTTVRSFINGVLDKTATNINWNISNSTPKIASGLNGAFTGYMNDFRVTNGIARYTANFTPPSRS